MHPEAARRFVSICLSMVLVFLSAPVSASTVLPYGASGPGGRNGLIYLYTAEELEELSRQVTLLGNAAAASGQYVLANAVNLSEMEWVPIGTAENPFTGSFDGKGHAITGLSVTGEGQALGFFGVLKGASVTGLNLTGVSIRGDSSGQSIGGIAGILRDGQISKCHVSGILSGGEDSWVGGIAGSIEASASGAVITHCASSGSVAGGTAGGLAGSAVSMISGGFKLTASYSSADVTASAPEAAAGGIAGRVEGSGGSAEISDCYALGQITALGSAYGMAGGIAGALSAVLGGSASVNHCYAVGAVEARGNMSSCAGGIAGYLDNMADMADITLAGNYAVNESVTAPLEPLAGGIVGCSEEESYTCESNFRIDGLSGEDAEQISGAELRKAESWAALTSRDEWIAPVNGRLPTLNGAPGDQRGALPLHLLEELDGVTGISDGAQLSRLARLVNQGGGEGAGSYRLVSDLDLSGLTWTPIGTATNPFTGSFDGGDYTVTGLAVDGEWDYGGLFGFVRGGNISGLAIRDCQIGGKLGAGSVAGYLETGRITGCTASGDISSEGSAGGIAGTVSGTAGIASCSFTGSVAGTAASGGIAGSLWGDLRDCHSAGTVRSGSDAGGIAGRSGGRISSSYSVSSVEGGASSGGVAGRMTAGTIENVRFIGFRTMGTGAGRVLGIMENGGTPPSAQAWDGALVNGSAVSESQNHGIGVPARRILSADFWRGFDPPVWSSEAGSLPLLAGPELLSGELPGYLWEYPEEGEAFGISAPDGNEFPVSSKDRLVPFRVNYSRWLNPTPTILWSLDSLLAGGPALIPNASDSSIASLFIPAGWSGSVTIFTSLKDWAGAEADITVYVNGELGLAGAGISINRDAVRYLDEPGLSFTPPSPRPAGLVTYTWLVNGYPVGTADTLSLTEPDWIGKSVKVRAEAENYGNAVESAALVIGKALYSGIVAEPSVQSKGSGSVTLTPLQGYEYACIPAGAALLPQEAGLWQSNTFTGLIDGYAYDFYQRAAESETTETSPVSDKLTVRLDAGDPPDPNPGPSPGPAPEPEPDTDSDPDSEQDQNPEPNPDPEPESTPNPPSHTPVEIAYFAPAAPSRGNSSSASTVGNTSRTPPSGPTPVSEMQAVSAVRASVLVAKASGADMAVVRLRNPGLISLRALQAMAAAAEMPLRVHADSLSPDGKRVDVRISFDPSNATKSLHLAASTDSTQAKSMTERFGASTVSFSQKTSFGMAVDVAAGLELPGVSPGRLTFRSYKRGVNEYRVIRDPLPQVDSKGYLHFRTEYAGDVAVFALPE